MRSSNQSSNRTFSLIHDILNDIDLGYPERISDFQSSDIPVIDQVIGKMAADAKHRLELSDVHDVRILRKYHQVQFSQLRLFHCHSSVNSSFISALE